MILSVRFTLFKEVQPLNTDLPILETLSPMVIEVIFLLFLKADGPISVMPLGIVTSGLSPWYERSTLSLTTNSSLLFSSTKFYRKLFKTHYNYVKYENEKCKECSLLKSCKKIRNKISDIEEKDIEDFFNCVKEIYLKWINSNPVDAINAFEDLLNNFL